MFNLTFVDMSQFVSEPLRTGVQRVLVKVIEQMPRDKIIPFRILDEQHAAILDPAVFDLAIRYFRGNNDTNRQRYSARLGSCHETGQEELLIKFLAANPIAVLRAERFFSRAARIVNLESFSRPERSRFYISCNKEYRKNIFHFIHDFLIFEAPSVFPHLNWRYGFDYILLFEAYCAAGGFYVSTPQMAQRVSEYFSRPLADVKVVHFGGDLEKGATAPLSLRDDEKRRIVVVGTIEPRKYPLIVSETLDDIAANDDTLECLLIGRWGWLEPEMRGDIQKILSLGRLRHYENLGDVEVTRIMFGADLAIYVSATEGFGLPAIEFAALGVPLITNSAVPAATLIKHASCIVLDEVSTHTLSQAIASSLGSKHSRAPYYSWKWGDCAEEIFDWDPYNSRVDKSVIDGVSCWRHCVRLVRALRSRDLGWEDLKSDIRRRLATERQLRQEVTLIDMNTMPSRETESLVEMLSEIVNDNLNLVFWADFIQLRGLLAELVLAVSAENIFDGISRAFGIFLGRSIDGRAASEAVRMVDRDRAFERIIELIYSEEAANFLGELTITPLRSAINAIRPVVCECLTERIDLFRLMELMGLPAPSLKDVVVTENLMTSGIGRLELLLHCAHRRKVTGDTLDLFLEVIAGVIYERELQSPGSAELESSATTSIIRSKDIVPGTEKGTSASNAAVGVPGDAVPKSIVRYMPIDSEGFDEGWYPAEYAHSGVFRWMGREGTVVNPDSSRPVREFVLDVLAVYGAHEPMVMGFMGEAVSHVTLESKLNDKGWKLRLFAPEVAVIRFVRLQALVADVPARAEGTTDSRELSLCASGATFVYGD